MSTVSNYGTMSCRDVKLASKIVFVGDTDDTKTITLKLNSDPSQVGNIDLNIPSDMTSAQTLLHNGSSIPVGSVDVNGATSAPGPAQDADEVMVYDASEAGNRKLALSALKTYIGEGIPSGSTDAQILISNAGTYANQTVGGDISINNSGNATIANNAVNNAKLANDAVDDNKISAGANISYSKLNLNNSIVNGDLAGSIADSKLASGPTAAKSAEASKYAKFDASRDLDNINELSASNLIGTTVQVTNQWRFNVSGGNLQFEFWNGASWVVKDTISSA